MGAGTIMRMPSCECQLVLWGGAKHRSTRGSCEGGNPGSRRPPTCVQMMPPGLRALCMASKKGCKGVHTAPQSAPGTKAWFCSEPGVCTLSGQSTHTSCQHKHGLSELAVQTWLTSSSAVTLTPLQAQTSCPARLQDGLECRTCICQATQQQQWQRHAPS